MICTMSYNEAASLCENRGEKNRGSLKVETHLLHVCPAKWQDGRRPNGSDIVFMTHNPLTE